jgi:exonuclease SbcD
VFDAARPPYDALRLGVRALTELTRVAPVVVVCGNHDSPALLMAMHELAGMADQRRLWLATVPQVITIPGLDDLAIACLPFMPPSAVVDLATTRAAKFEGTYADEIRRRTSTLLDEAEAKAGSRGIVVYAAHLHVHGAKPSKSERRITVGDDYATHVDSLGRAMYSAFGHIHDPQLLPGGTVTGRYAGSIVPIDYGEATQAKHSVLVELGADIRVTELPLPSGRPLLLFNGTLDELEARAAGGGFDGTILKARVVSDDPVLDLADRLAAWSPGCAVFDLVNAVSRRRVRAIGATDRPEAEPTLDELFREWRGSAARTDARSAPDDAVVELFRESLSGGDGTVPDLGVTASITRAQTALDELTAAARQR